MPYNDVPKVHWSYKFILSAYNNGWMSGYPDGIFGIERMITRAETFVIINRVLGWRIPSVSAVNDKQPIDLNGKEWYYNDVILAMKGSN